MIVARLLIRVLSIIGMLVMVRLLTPEDFGLVALVAAAIAFSDVLGITNYTAVLVRHPAATRLLYDTAWTLNVVRCLVLSGLIAGTAHWQAAILGDPRLAPVLIVVSLGILLDGCTSIGMARLQRDLQFSRIFQFQVVSKSVGFIVSVVLAILLQNYWCLVLGNLAAKVICVPYSYWLAPHRPRVSFREAGELLSFSWWMLAINVFSTADSHGPNMILGRWDGVSALGAYQVAYYVAAVPVHEVAVPVRQPIYSGYARVLHDNALLQRHFLAGFGFLGAAMIPLSVGIALTAPEIARIALGADWLHVAPLITLCALYSLTDCLAAFSINIFVVLDKLRSYLKTLILLVFMRVPLVLGAVLLWGAVGMAAAMLATAVVNAIMWQWQVSHLLGHRLRDVGSEIWRSLTAATLMSGSVLALREVLPFEHHDLWSAAVNLSVLAGSGACVHIVSLLALWRLSGCPDSAEARLLDITETAVRRAKAYLVSRA